LAGSCFLFISPLLAVLFLIALPNLRLETLLEEIRGQRGVDAHELERNIEWAASPNIRCNGLFEIDLQAIDPVSLAHHVE
jgi:hypothetical protein